VDALPRDDDLRPVAQPHGNAQHPAGEGVRLDDAADAGDAVRLARDGDVLAANRQRQRFARAHVDAIRVGEHRAAVALEHHGAVLDTLGDTMQHVGAADKLRGIAGARPVVDLIRSPLLFDPAVV